MESETALTTPTTAFVTDWTRLACRRSPAIQSIRRPARWTVITFRFMSDDDDLHFAELPAFNEGISQIATSSSPTIRSALTIGYIGGLTTYSSFNYESTRLLQDGAHGLAALNAAVTLVGCFAAGWLGLITSRQLFGQ